MATKKFFIFVAVIRDRGDLVCFQAYETGQLLELTLLMRGLFPVTFFADENFNPLSF